MLEEKSLSGRKILLDSPFLRLCVYSCSRCIICYVISRPKFYNFLFSFDIRSIKLVEDCALIQRIQHVRHSVDEGVRGAVGEPDLNILAKLLGETSDILVCGCCKLPL